MRDNISPKFWGPSTWRSLFTSVLSFPKYSPSSSERRYFRNYFESLQGVLPCATCRHNTEKFLRRHPVEDALRDRYTLLIWVIRLHNKSSAPIRNYNDLREVIRSDKATDEIIDKIERDHPKLRLK